MTCPDAECHSNLHELKEDMKKITACISKKVKRWELWVVVFGVLTLFVPIALYSFSVNHDWKKELEEKSAANKMAIIEYRKDIINTNEKICEIQSQQKQLPDIVYKAVKEAIKQ